MFYRFDRGQDYLVFVVLRIYFRINAWKSYFWTSSTILSSSDVSLSYLSKWRLSIADCNHRWNLSSMNLIYLKDWMFRCSCFWVMFLRGRWNYLVCPRCLGYSHFIRFYFRNVYVCTQHARCADHSDWLLIWANLWISAHVATPILF